MCHSPGQTLIEDVGASIACHLPVVSDARDTPQITKAAFDLRPLQRLHSAKAARELIALMVVAAQCQTLPLSRLLDSRLAEACPCTDSFRTWMLEHSNVWSGLKICPWTSGPFDVMAPTLLSAWLPALKTTALLPSSQVRLQPLTVAVHLAKMQ